MNTKPSPPQAVLTDAQQYAHDRLTDIIDDCDTGLNRDKSLHEAEVLGVREVAKQVLASSLFDTLPTTRSGVLTESEVQSIFDSVSNDDPEVHIRFARAIESAVLAKQAQASTGQSGEVEGLLKLEQLLKSDDDRPITILPDGSFVVNGYDEGDMLRFMHTLHGNVPEADRPQGRSDYSDAQWKRIDQAFATLRAAPSQPSPESVAWPRTVDELANIIRFCDGENKRGAGDLAERIFGVLALASASPVAGAQPTTKQLMETLAQRIQADDDYAWSWHCNLAMMAVDAGAPHYEANCRATDFMGRLFNVDTSQYPHFPKPPASPPAPARAEAGEVFLWINPLDEVYMKRWDVGVTQITVSREKTESLSKPLYGQEPVASDMVMDERCPHCKSNKVCQHCHHCGENWE